VGARLIVQHRARSGTTDPVASPHRIEQDIRDGVAALTLVAPDEDLHATFVPSAGMVGCSLRHRGVELLGKTDHLAAYRARGATMGIPLLHPWANRLADHGYAFAGRDVVFPPHSPFLHYEQNDLPIHGIPGPVNPDWTITEEHADGAHARIGGRLEFSPSDDLLALFPFPHTVDVAVTLRGDTLTIHTTVLATGDVDVPVSFGYHPYLQLPDVPRAGWHVELPARRHLLLDAHSIPTGETEDDPPFAGPLADHAFDDAYDDLGGDEFVLAGGGRRVAVRFDSGYPVAQVFAPPDDDVVCFEPMTAPVNALRTHDGLPVLRPGESFAAQFSIAVTGRD
jgi:galactose mutarotase-like enzyme